MIRPVVFSNGHELGDAHNVDVLLFSLVFETGHFDMLAVVRTRGRTLVRHFPHESEDQHTHRCVQWAKESSGIAEHDLLRCPDFGHELRAELVPLSAEQLADRAGRRAGIVAAHTRRGTR